jgi:hypothetical protein
MGKPNAINQFILDTAFAILDENYPITVRRLHYLLAGRIPTIYKNTHEQYNTLCRLTTVARKSGVLPYELFDDPTRITYSPLAWESLAEYVEFATTAYARNKWQDQPNRCEVWIEKDGLLSVFQPICRELQVTLRSMHGQCSNTGCYAAAKTLAEMPEDVEIHILYFGDQDPTGEQIPKSAKLRTQDILKKKFGQDRILIFDRLGFNYEDFAEHNIESIDEKPADKLLKAYLEKYGPNAKFAEVDSLPTDVLIGRVEKAVAALIDGNDPESDTSPNRVNWYLQESFEQMDREKITDALGGL